MKRLNIFISAILMVAGFSLNAQVAITTNGSSADGSAMLDVQSTSKGFLPPRMTQVQRDAITPVAGLIIYNSSTNKPNYYNGTEWMNCDGSTAKTLAIGVAYQGGIIAYILQSGDPGYNANVQHGIIAAPSDQSTGATWGCQGTAITGADGIAIGTGNQNTLDIVAGCATAGIAARICNDLVLGGYSDWCLPSIYELNKLYLNKVAIGGFASAGYWSSSEYTSYYAQRQDFYYGDQLAKVKSDNYYVRAVRAF